MKVPNKLFLTLLLSILVMACNAQQGLKLDSIKTQSLLQNDYKWAKFDLNLVKESSFLKASKFNASTLPFFCKMEHQLQLKSRIPVRIRLGAVDYVNKMESKH